MGNVIVPVHPFASVTVNVCEPSPFPQISPILYRVFHQLLLHEHMLFRLKHCIVPGVAVTIIGSDDNTYSVCITTTSEQQITI